MIRICRYAAAVSLLLVALLIGALPNAPPARAQTAPGATVNANLLSFFGPVTTIAAAAAPTTIAWLPNGMNCMLVRVSGTYTGLASTVQVSTLRTGTPLWTNAKYVVRGGLGGSAIAIAINGLYAIDVGGAAQARLNITALSTGSVVVSASGTQAACSSAVAIIRNATFSAAIHNLAPAASATDFFVISGAAGVTVKVSQIACTGVSTAAATALVDAIVRSTADTTGTSTTLTNVAHDINDATGLAVVKAYTANPGALGTSVGLVRSGLLTTNTLAASAFNSAPLVWNFGGATGNEEVVLRGATQSLALNANAQSFSAGAALDCSATWTEE